ncbi:3-oxoacyl-ACP reductase FabG [Streptomyces sp. CA-210063]|uniref:3-oxoacyl-ACP reductase FabG n=1 Tax=Streptomyces sp. CA-210063 TaxID=2801029 RepID=UPI00214C7D02|nr:3-oxoacyl-ACP reductase FabG [Streptomyces sp. CA-210063]UUU28665.1 3-oxoacyl-ACP reductase FabG [Streptomyces sp. CA-210063]
MGLLDGRHAVITGGAQGIGLEIAGVLGAEGASVVLGDINADAAAQAAERLTRSGVAATSLRCDVTDEHEVAALIAHGTAAFGPVGIMVNNAGITRDATLRKMALADFRAVVDVHLTGAWNGTRYAAEAMRAHGQGGSIVNISSIAGKVGNFGQTNYSAAKAGLVGLTKASAKELAKAGIRVNAVQPGLIRTAMTEAMPPAAWDAKLAEIPMGRAGEPAEVAQVVLFLASGLASYVTGAVVEVTGGRYM